MTRIDFNRDWHVSSNDDKQRAVTLPHDAMLHERRDPNCRNGVNTGYFPGGVYHYSKNFDVPAAWRGKRISLFFEGSYRHTQVELNGIVVGARPSGYAEFHIALDDHLILGEQNNLRVVVDNSQEPNSRWYSGSGLYRRVWLDIREEISLARDSLHYDTQLEPGAAKLSVAVAIDTAFSVIDAELELRLVLLKDGQQVAATSSSILSQADIAAPVALQLLVSNPSLWSAESPELYRLHISLLNHGQEIDSTDYAIGLRTIVVDAVNGLRINGIPVLLRGGCIHHDHGVLGAATYRDAEFRRAQILKDNGFNAVRAGHAPLPRDFLDACDQIGLYVIDELTDLWFEAKTRHDYANDFNDWWRTDLESMIVKSRTHPSVIMYSIGNENGESAKPEGIKLGQEMVDFCHRLDASRPVTSGVNPMLNGLASFGRGVFDADEKKKKASANSSGKKESAIGSALFNQITMRVGPIMNAFGRFGFVDRATKGIAETLNVTGYNYGSGAYKLVGKRYPERVIMGTETLPGDIVKNWGMVETLPYLIGEFIWTAWDHLGEASIGSWTYGVDATVKRRSAYPYLLSGCGAIDLIGHPGVMSYLMQATWNTNAEPMIAVRPLDKSQQNVFRSPWRSSDAIASWSWPGYEGVNAEVEVYSGAEFVELLLNGKSLGTKPAGRSHGCKAVFNQPYEPGELVAIARDNGGTVVGRGSLVSAAADLALRVRADKTLLQADGHSLAFIEIDVVDKDGVICSSADATLYAEVSGAASLLGFGSANPKPMESYISGLSRSYYGRALAVVRAGHDAGVAEIRVVADGFGEQTISLEINADKSLKM